jgi:hypothetical protein
MACCELAPCASDGMRRAKATRPAWSGALRAAYTVERKASRTALAFARDALGGWLAWLASGAESPRRIADLRDMPCPELLWVMVLPPGCAPNGAEAR